MSQTGPLLSPQDLQDLHAIRQQLPAGDPRVGKINQLVMAHMQQPTQFEKERTPEPDWGFMPSHLAQQAWEGIRSLASGTYQLGKDVLSKQPLSETYKKDVLQPLDDEMNKAFDLWKQGRHSEAVGHYIASYLPFLGPWAASLGEQVGRQDVGGALAQAGSQYFVGRAAEVAPEKAKSALRFATGTSSEATAKAAQLHAEDIAKAQEAYRQKASEVADVNRQSLAASRQLHEEKVAEIQGKNTEARMKHADAVRRVQDANTAARSAVAQGQSAESTAGALASAVSGVLPTLFEAEKTKAKAAYPEIKGSLPNNEIYANLQTIVDDKLKGSGNVPGSLAKILKDIEPLGGKSTGPSVMGKHFDLSNPRDLAAYEKWKAQGAFTPEEIRRIEGTSGEPVGFDDLHGMYSELGRELYAGNLPGDSRSALSAARDYIGQKMDQLADAQGPQVKQQFLTAQRGWRIFENVFRNSDPAASGGSPLAKALRTRDPISGELRPVYVRAILSDPKAAQTAIDLLGHVPGTDVLKDSLRLLRDSAAMAKGAPRTAKLKQEPPPPIDKPMPASAAVSLRPTPPAPVATPFDPAAWRNEQIQKWAISKQQLRPYDFMKWRLPFTITQQIMSRMLLDPHWRKLLVTDTPAPTSRLIGDRTVALATAGLSTIPPQDGKPEQGASVSKPSGDVSYIAHQGETTPPKSGRLGEFGKDAATGNMLLWDGTKWVENTTQTRKQVADRSDQEIGNNMEFYARKGMLNRQAIDALVRSKQITPAIRARLLKVLPPKENFNGQGR